MTSVVAPGGAFSIEDLDTFPRDSNRYELIEGSLHVTPVPAPIHQRISANLFRLLDAAAPADLAVLYAPLDVQLGPDTVVQPDIVVIPAGELPDRRLEGPPLLVVEILSPTTRAHDLGAKAYVYREAGVGAYWVVDPAVPSITTWRWGNRDEPARTAEGHDVATLDWPLTVSVTPARLLLPRG